MVPIHAFLINLTFRFIYTLIVTFFIRHNIVEEVVEAAIVEEAAESPVVEEVVEAAIEEDEEVEEEIRLFRQSMNNLRNQDVLRHILLLEDTTILSVLQVIADCSIDFKTSMLLAIEARRMDVIDELLTHVEDVDREDLLDFVNETLRISFLDGLQMFFDRLNAQHPNFVNHIDKKAISAAARDEFFEGLTLLWNSENVVLRARVVHYSTKYRLLQYLQDLQQLPPSMPKFVSKPQGLQVRWEKGLLCPIFADLMDDMKDLVCCALCGHCFKRGGIEMMVATGRENCPICCSCNEYCIL